MLYKENNRKSLKYILKLFAASLGEPIRHLAESSEKSMHSRDSTITLLSFITNFLIILESGISCIMDTLPYELPKIKYP